MQVSRMRARQIAAVALLSATAYAQQIHISRLTTRPDGRQIGAAGVIPGECGYVRSLSDDGRFATVSEYMPSASLPVDTRLLDRADGSQVPIALGVGGAPLNKSIENAYLSGDASRSFFESKATNVPGGLSIPQGGVFMVERATGQLSRVSQGIGGSAPNGLNVFRSTTTNGRFVVFDSWANNVVPSDLNNLPDVFLADMQSGSIVRISVATGGSESHGNSTAGRVSFDGRFVAFSNDGDDLSPSDHNSNASDAYLRDLQLGTTELVSVTPAGVAGNAISYGAWVSDDGLRVAFQSYASDIVPGDTNGAVDLFVRDRLTGTTSLVLLTSSGGQVAGDIHGMLSSDGASFAFSTNALNVVPGDTNAMEDVFCHDFASGLTERLSLTPTGGQATQWHGMQPYAAAMAISAGGRFVSVHSTYSDLVHGDTSGGSDGFLVDRASGVAPVTTYCTAKPTSTGCLPVITCSGEPRASGLDCFYVSASRVRRNTRGAFGWSLAPSATPFGGGTLCIASPYRLIGVSSGAYGGTTGTCNQGQFVFHPSHAFFAANALSSGTTIYAQFLARDDGFAAPNNIGLTDAITFTIGP